MAERTQQPVEQPTELTETQISRRSFLKLAWGAVGAAMAAEAGLVTYRFFSPKVVDGEFGSVFAVGAVDDFPPGSVTQIKTGHFYLVRLEDGGFMALYHKCTHLGCSVPWNQAEGKFICPCHASAFEADGGVINPPAPRPLDRFAVSIEDGLIKVDTGERIRRDKTDPAAVVYA